MNLGNFLRLLVGLAFFCSIKVSAQTSCFDTTFVNHYRFKGTGSGGFTVFSPDSSILLGAMLSSRYITNGINLDREISLLRVRSTGDTAWSKKLVYPSYPILGFYSPSAVSIGDKDQTYLVGTWNFLTRVDSSGNVLANMMIKGADTLSIKCMVLAPDGDKILLLENGTWERSALLIRVSGDLSNVKWVKNIESSTQYDHLKIWKVVINGNQVACIGYWEVGDRKAMILAFNYKSGQFLHSKAVPFNNPAPSTFNIQPFDSGYILQGRSIYGDIGGNGIIKIDTAFNIKSVFRFNDFETYASSIIGVQRDGGFYRLAANNNFTQVLHVSKNNVIDFKTHFAFWYISNSTAGLDVHETASNLFFTITGNTLDPGINNLATYLGIYKTSLEGYVGQCNLYDDVVGYERIPWTEINMGSIRVKDDTVTLVDFKMIMEPLPLRIDKLCTAVSSCKTLKIMGPNSTCTNQVTFTGRKSTQCKLPVKWSVLGNPDVMQSKANDSTVTIHFNKPGDYTIEAALVGSCSYIADSIVVHVSQSATLNLGKDTSICKEDSLILKVEGDYKSVTWQDGSENYFILVKQPGVYVVNAEANCGGYLSDTILITQKTSTLINLGPDRSKCDNDTLNLKAPIGFLNYHWSSTSNINLETSAAVVVNPLVDTSYFLKAQNANGCFSYDTIKINLHRSRQVFLGNDTSICAGIGLVLKASDGFASYHWSNGGQMQTLAIDSSEIYAVKVTNAEGCIATDTIKVAIYPTPVVELDDNTKLCFGTNRILNPGNFAKYRWHDGSGNKTFSILNTGTYYVEVTDANGCKASDTSRILTIVPLPSGFLPHDTSVCQYNPVTVQPSGSFKSYTWNSNQTTRTISVSRPGTFWLKVKDVNNCEGIDSITIIPKQCANGLFVPSAFTPNNDGKNDYLQALLFGDIKKFELKIYNRFGQVVFQTSEPYNKWNGMVNGVDQNAGVYVWTCNYKLATEPEKMEKGTSVLIR